MNGFMVGPYFWSKNSTQASEEASWKNTSAYTMSMNSLSFCLLATAILILMFLVMAILERLLRSSGQASESPPLTAAAAQEEHRVYSAKRVDSSPHATASDTFDFPVLMPGRLCPTHLAKPAPLPCPREGILWPSQAPRAFLASSPKSQPSTL